MTVVSDAIIEAATVAPSAAMMRTAPGDDTDAVFICIDLFHSSDDLFRALAGGEVFHRNRHELIYVRRHFLGVLRYVR